MKIIYYTQIRETSDGFVVVAGENPAAMQEVGRKNTFAEAQLYRNWWVRSMGDISHINHGFVPLSAMQGHVPGH